MSKDARSELITAIARRYGESGRGEKTRILDEFVAVTGYHRKHALRVLHRAAADRSSNSTGIRARIYDQAVSDALVVVWEAGDRMCGKRLKAALPGLLQSVKNLLPIVGMGLRGLGLPS